jgi:iron-sulfur cluster assembly accessory protein
MIHLTEAAATRIKELATEDARSLAGLRIFVDTGGCSGLQYNMMIDEPHAEDARLEEHGARLSVDQASADYLKGSTVDFEESLTSTGFRIRNPNAKQTCGCGTSFEA